MQSKRKNIKICFFSPASYPFFEPNSNVAHGGAELQMFLLAEYLSQKSDFNINFFVGNYGQKKKYKNDNVLLIRTVRLHNKENLFIKLIKALKYFFQLIKLKPDILIATNANALVGINAFYCKIFKKKFIYRSSHLIDVNNDYIKNNGISGKLYKYGLLNSKKIITQNKEHQILLKKNHNINAEVLKNGFKLNDFKKIEKKNILWVSRFQKWKQPELFLKLAQYFKQYEFMMICPYTASEKNNWNNFKIKADKIPNLKFIEKVKFNEIQEYFDKAELFVNTSDFEGFPNTFLQAAQSKTPIISLNVNPDNFITEYNCGIFAEGNFDKMLSEMKALLKNENELKIKGENLFKYLKNNHDFNIIGKKFINIIETLL